LTEVSDLKTVKGINKLNAVIDWVLFLAINT
jgi:hypothetical protein